MYGAKNRIVIGFGGGNPISVSFILVGCSKWEELHLLSKDFIVSLLRGKSDISKNLWGKCIVYSCLEFSSSLYPIVAP